MIDAVDCRLLAAVQSGLPISPRPYAEIGARLELSEAEVIERLGRMLRQGPIKRWGVVVKHRQLGYRANAMIVIDVPDQQVAAYGELLGRQACVNLCYRRPRQGERWPYNLYCMIHGKSRDTVLQQWAKLRESCGLRDFSHEVLFSKRCFKQRGALYLRGAAVNAEIPTLESA